jgi:hypothetical protein
MCHRSQTSVHHLAVSFHQNAISSRAIPVSWNIPDGVRNNSQYGSICLCAKPVRKMVRYTEEFLESTWLTERYRRLDFAWALWWIDSIIAMIIAIGVPFVM